jgi:hypothetical protein
MKKDTTKPERWNDEWCPLFGALPACDERDGITENCLRVIVDARGLWGTFEYFSGLKCPDPERIEKNTLFPATWIRSARLLTMPCATNDILLSARHQQGMLQAGTGWIKGKDGEPFLLFDVDQLTPRSLLSAIRTRAGIAHDFLCALIETDERLLFKDDGKPRISVGMIYALLAIGSAWDIMEAVAQNYVRANSVEASSGLLTAEKLLKSANADSLAFTNAKQLWEREKSKLAGRDGYKKGVGHRHIAAETQHAEWQCLANRIVAEHPDWDKKRVAIKIAKETGGNFNTIRRKIKK